METLNECVEQLEKCSFIDKLGHPIENNIAFIQIKTLSEICECAEPPDKDDKIIRVCGRCNKIVEP